MIIRVVIVPQWSAYFAQCLEVNVCTLAPTLRELKESLRRVVTAHIEFSNQRGPKPLPSWSIMREWECRFQEAEVFHYFDPEIKGIECLKLAL